MPAFPSGTPRREALDDIVPDRPVFLVNRDGHGAWVNSRALELAGIDAGTPDPSDGRIERDAVGAPTGTLHEGAMDLVGRLAPPATQTDMERALLLAQRRLHAFGVTAWQDAWVTPPDLEAYRALAGRGELTARVVAALWWDRHRGLEQVDDLVAQRERGMVGRLRATSVKIMQDGVCENFTAAMLSPYLDPGGRPTSNRGLSQVEPALLRAAVTRLDAEGFQVGTGPSVRRWTRSRPPWRRTDLPTTAITSPTSSSSTPTTSRGSAAWASWRTPSRTGPATTTR